MSLISENSDACTQNNNRISLKEIISLCRIYTLVIVITFDVLMYEKYSYCFYNVSLMAIKSNRVCDFSAKKFKITKK